MKLQYRYKQKLNLYDNKIFNYLNVTNKDKLVLNLI